MFKKNNKAEKELQKQKEAKALEKQKIQNLINVSDIIGGNIICKDGYLTGIINVLPVNISLLSNREKIRKKDLVKEKLNTENDFEFFKISKSIDFSEQINYLQELARNSDNHLKKMALLESIRTTSKYTQKGDMVENQYYYIFRVKNEDEHSIKLLRDKMMDFIDKMADCEIKAYSLQDMELTQLCSLYCNPTTYTEEFELNEYVSSFIGG